MHEKEKQVANFTDTVVGVFLDRQMAEQAVQQLQAQGFNAQIDEQGNFQGFPPEQADIYNSRLQEGNTIVRVNDPSDRGEEALNTMLGAGAENIDLVRGQGTGQQGFANWNNQQRGQYYQNLNANQRQYGTIDQQTGRGRTADQIRVALREEQLIPTKTQQQAGEVQVHKVVHEKEQQIPVTLRHEEVTISRQAVDRPLQEGELTDFQDEVISVPVYEEQAQLQKQGRVREEVTINKEAREHQETLSGTTRHEHLEVQPGGDIRVQGDTGNSGYTTETTTQTNINQDQYGQS
jgi:uncharacterized protein (TIGR02271 family)